MSTTPRRVVITGMGLISPLGNTKEALWNALIEGRSGVTACPTPMPETATVRCVAATGFQGKVDEFGPLSKEQTKQIRKGLKLMCRETQMGVAAAQLALSDAAFPVGSHTPERCGLVFGTDYMLSEPDEFNEGIVRCRDASGEFHFDQWGTEGMGKMSPLWLLKYLPNMPASHLAIFNDFRGANNSLTMREAAGNLAVWEGLEVIRRGHAEAILAGATGTRIHPMKVIHAMQQEEIAQSDEGPERASRPFDLHRTGMVPGEGAAAILMEDAEAAEARGATIYAEVVAGASSQASGPGRAPDCRKALANVLAQTLRSAAIEPSQLGHIHAHGLATRAADLAEAQAIRDVLGDQAASIPLTTAKGHMGNLGAASGLVELIASVVALGHDTLFPVLNLETIDPECPVAAVAARGIPAGSCFVNLSVTPQGQASAVLVRRYA
ncbi:MAG: beta-ketoacyl-[acyl-carrier-protein] synthase family protein [Patescibacteria group bacterium]|nr:beta-ketoacyl-[acyl-carrier-protein] synthase family protein [Patescibacteria group bacterium]